MQFAGGLRYGEKTKDQGCGEYKGYCQQKCSKTALNSIQCDNHLDKMEKSTKTSEENKMVEAKRLESKNKFKMEVIKSGIVGGQEDWQKVAEIIHCQNGTG